MTALISLLQPNDHNWNSPDGIVQFVREILGVKDLAPYQEDILRMFVEQGRVAVRGPHGPGKTALSSWVVLWALCAFDEDVKIVTTASHWRQLINYTWPEIHKWARQADWQSAGILMRHGKELLERNVKLGNKLAFAATSDEPETIEGAHASVMVYVFDEAKLIQAGIWDAAEGAFSTAGDDTGTRAYALAISTPGNPSGRFYDICKRKPGYQDWATRHITLEESIAAGRMSRDWADKRRVQWGEKSAIYQNKVLGEFAEEDTNVVVPLSWVELANERWWAWRNLVDAQEVSFTLHNPHYGCDPAFEGEDRTTIAEQRGRVITSVESFAKQDLMVTAGKIAERLRNAPDARCAIDIIGIGAGTYSRLREQRFKGVIPVNAGARAEDHNGKPLKDRTGLHTFKNLRSYIWWLIREALDPAHPESLALPPIDELTGDLTAPTFVYLSDGTIQVESKPDIKARIGRSTDFADAVGLVLYASRYQFRKMQITA